MCGLCQDDPIEAEQLGQRPGLKRAPARCVRLIGIGDLGDVTEPGMIQVLNKRREKTRTRLALRCFIAATHTQPGFDKRSDQPRPHRALVIGAVALADAALIVGGVAGLCGREGTQAERRPKALLYGVNDPSGLFVVDDLKWQAAHGEDD